MMRVMIAFACLLLTRTVSNAAIGYNYTWTGAGNGVTWESSSNWASTNGGTAYPFNPGDSATFDGTAASASITLNSETFGYLTFTAGNAARTYTFSGTKLNAQYGTTINGGTMELGSTNILTTPSVALNNGSHLNDGGFADATGAALSVGTGTIDLGSTVHTLSFASLSNPTVLLTIANWYTSDGTTGSEGKVVLTSTTDGTTFTNVQFSGYSAGAVVLPSGELVPLTPAPEPSAIFGGSVLSMGLIRLVRRKRSSEPSR